MLCFFSKVKPNLLGTETSATARARARHRTRAPPAPPRPSRIAIGRASPLSDDVFLVEGLLVQDTLETEAGDVHSAITSCGNEFGHRTPRTRSLLQPMSREPIAQDEVRDVRMLAYAAILAAQPTEEKRSQGCK